MSQYSKEVSFAKDLAREAGEIIRNNFSKSTRTIKSNNTPVTETDLAVSNLIHDRISKRFPDHAIMDEEKSNEYAHSHEYVWICDPIDGTIPFSHRIPTSMFSLGLCKDGKSLLGVAYDPYMDRLYHAVHGKGASLNDKPITVGNQRLSRGETLFTIPYWFAPRRSWSDPFDYNKFFAICHKKGIITSTVESIVYLSMLFAEGAIVGAVMPSAYPWDRAAATVIIREAGGVMTDEKGRELEVFGDHRLIIIANPQVHPELLSLIQSCLL